MMDAIEEMRRKALATLKSKKAHEAKMRAMAAKEPHDELAALRAAALKSKLEKEMKSSARAGSDEAVCSSPVSGPSKFRRHDDSEQSEDETSEISILEEVTADSDDEALGGAASSDHLANRADSSDEQAVPDLLQESVDITEFDEDDLLLEEEILTPQLKKMSRTEQRSSAKNTTNNSRSNAVTHRNGVRTEKESRLQTNLTGPARNGTNPRRDRSRSPILRTRSPQYRREITPPLNYNRRTSNSPSRRRTPPLQHNEQLKHSPSRRRSPPSKQSEQRSDMRDRLSHSPRPDLRTRLSPKPPDRDVKRNKQQDIIETSSADDTLNHPNITGNDDRKTLLKRKEKFSKEKISSGKKTVKLKKSTSEKSTVVKKKTSITKRLGAKKPKVIRVKSQSPEIIETVSLDKDLSQEVDQDDNSSQEEKNLSTAAPSLSTISNTSQTVSSNKGQRKSLKERLGGYAKPDKEKVAAKRAQREISIDSSPEPEIKLAKVEKKTSKSNPKSGLTNKRRVILEDSVQEADQKPAEPSRKSRVSVTKRNIWSRRDKVTEENLDARNEEIPGEAVKPKNSISISTADLRKRRRDESEQTESSAPKEKLTAATAPSANLLPSDSDEELDLSDDDLPAVLAKQKPKKSEYKAAKISMSSRVGRTGSAGAEVSSARDRNSAKLKTMRDSNEAEKPYSRVTERRRTREVSESEDRNSGSNRLSRLTSRDSEERLSRRAAWSASRKNRSQDSNNSDENRPNKTDVKPGKTMNKEKELDERIRKIKEANAKREQRQREIEKEKLLYG